MIILLFLSFTLALDAFLVSLIYSTNKIKISNISIIIISLISVFLLSISLFLSDFLSYLLPQYLLKLISFVLLFAIGITSIIKNKINNNSKIIEIYCDKVKADLDNSKTIDYKEAIILGITLSLDSIGSGIAFGLIINKYLLFIFLTFIFNYLLIKLGFILGNKIKINENLEWIGGVLLIVIAFYKLLF